MHVLIHLNGQLPGNALGGRVQTLPRLGKETGDPLPAPPPVVQQGRSDRRVHHRHDLPVRPQPGGLREGRNRPEKPFRLFIRLGYQYIEVQEGHRPRQRLIYGRKGLQQRFQPGAQALPCRSQHPALVILHPGSLFGGKALLATVVKSDTVRVDFSMTALDYLRGKDRNVNLGSDDPSRKWNSYVTVTLADGSQYPYEGLVDFADPQVDPKTGTFSVRAEMPNPDRSLLPGEFTKVKVLLDVRENAVEIPYKALVIEKNGAYVFVVRPDGVVEKRFVEIGPQSGNNIIVERGLAKGEKIVVEGYHKLSHGMKVDAIEAPADSVPAVNINPPADSVPATGKEG